MTQPLLEVPADAGALARRATELMLAAARAKDGAFALCLAAADD